MKPWVVFALLLISECSKTRALYEDTSAVPGPSRVGPEPSQIPAGFSMRDSEILAQVEGANAKCKVVQLVCEPAGEFMPAPDAGMCPSSIYRHAPEMPGDPLISLPLSPRATAKTARCCYVRFICPR